MKRSRFIGGSACAAALGFAGIGSVDASCISAAGAHQISEFVDAFLAEQMKRYAVPGAAASVVSGRSLLFARGYGLADVEAKRLVDARNTLVRAYSVSKAFTATAVIQLVESGKLSLTENVNAYLELFKIPKTFDQPITLAHLLTHTAGFVDDNSTLLAMGTKRSLSLGEWLKDYMAPRQMPPGTKVQYSNYGFSLAGYIVEAISNRPYAEYMQQFVLDPLTMSTSSFLWPSQLPEVEEAKVASGYARSSSRERVIKLSVTDGDFANTPAANLLTTVEQITHFMIAQLNGGIYQGARILSESSVQTMHRPYVHPVNDWYRADNGKRDIGYGFFWRDIDGHTLRWLFHAGGYDGSISDMELQPELALGYFLWYDQGGDDDRRLRSEFNTAFGDRFISGQPACRS